MAPMGAVSRMESTATARSHQSPEATPAGQGHGADGGLDRGRGDIGYHTKELFFYAQVCTEKGDISFHASEQKTYQNHKDSRQTSLPGHPNIDLGTHQHKQEEFRKHPELLQFLAK